MRAGSSIIFQVKLFDILIKGVANMGLRSESDDLYLELIADMSRATIPTSIMCLYLVLVYWIAWTATSFNIFLYSCIIGGGSSMMKMTLMRLQVRRLAGGDASVKYAISCEITHAVLEVLIAASVGCATAEAFLLSKPDFEILTSSLLFGYCSGIVARLAIRPKIACLVLVIATAPTIFSASQASDLPHHILTGMLSLFLIGGFETTRHIYLTNVRNITTRLEMATLARNDPLTGLANRLGLRQAFRIAAKLPGNIAIHCLDLDGFKSVNDRLGHAGGDAILVGVAERLLSLDPKNTTVARVGGDEFVVLQSGILQTHRADKLAHDIVDILSNTFTVGDQVIEIGVSVGSCTSKGNCSLDYLLCRADEASYVAKRERAKAHTLFPAPDT
jgi:diguanylate cyclase (GGDEF)-like protein